jgi:hypothetical protein
LALVAVAICSFIGNMYFSFGKWAWMGEANIVHRNNSYCKD